MVWDLLIKDLKRALHNPWPYVINLALPLCITALIGLAFGPASKGGGLGQIKLAVVDQDDSVLSSLLRGAVNQGEAKKYLSVTFPAYAEAMKQIQANQVSAVLIITKGFSRDYLRGTGPVRFELIKNPAQSFYPAIVEELVQVVVTALSAISRNLRSDLPQWLEVLEKEGKPDLQAVSRLIVRMGSRLDRVEKYLFPPLIGYQKEIKGKGKADSPAVNIFGFLLPGLAAMFMLFLADHSIRDLYREMRAGTFDRFRTLQHRTLPFIVSKVVLAIAVLLLGSVVLFAGGALIFGIRWKHPAAMFLVILAYALFASGFMSFVAALARSERRADVMNSCLTMMIAFMGGSFFPTRNLPGFLRDHVSPFMPNYWFIEGIRALQEGSAAVSWTLHTGKLMIIGVVLVLAASLIFQRVLAKGARA